MSVRGDMTISGTPDAPPPVAPPDGAWPAQAHLILSSLDAGRHTAVHDRRAVPRQKYRARGWLRLFSDGPDQAARVVYTRDVSACGLGFITPHRLPLGYGGLIELPRPDGTGSMTVHCTLLRCREAAPGWYEGSVYFNREQPSLVPGRTPTRSALKLHR